MNFEKFINSDYLKENPLCGIDTYKDELNLTTGACTRQIKKLELTGEESTGFYWKNYTSSDNSLYYIRFAAMQSAPLNGSPLYCTHLQNINYTPSEVVGIQVAITYDVIYFNLGLDVMNAQPSGNTVAGLKEYLAAQYAAGTPVTVWYVLATPTIETITVPSGLSGTVEGYLNQSGTPTPTNPIYPTANTIEQWFDLNHYIMGTSTDTITTLPADIYANDTTATVGLKGQAVQSSTPSPTSPIMPDGTGERTGNLLDLNGAKKDYYIDQGGVERSSEYSDYEFSYTKLTPVEPNATYTLSINVPQHIYSRTNRRIHAYDASGNWIEQIDNLVVTDADVGVLSLTFTTPSTCKYVTINYLNDTYDNGDIWLMLNTGSTALPYENFGYKIPISMGGTTNNVYLGEVQTTRNIRKLVLDGTENFSNQYGTNLFSVVIQPLGKISFFNSYCTHYKYNPTQSGLNTNTQNGEYALQVQSTQSLLAFKDTAYSSAADFKTYLQQQYTNGTPVTVWYVLATPTTGIVNEPLMRIGDYADSLTTSIPCTAGSNTLDVQTTVHPSEVTAGFSGWHPAIVHERTNGAWT